MRQPKVASRYAKALFDLAVETGALEKVKDDINTIAAAAVGDLNTVMVSPVIRGDQKEKIFAAIFGDKVSPLTISFFNLVFKKGREVAIREIMEAYMDLYRAHHHIQKVEITTATPVEPQVHQQILDSMRKVEGYEQAKFDVSPKVDPSIVGGFVLQVGDNLFDASIRHDLQTIKKQFIENMYVQNIR
ncbi:MAG: ATP synthase F1 subunit delta [Sphingobacteriales bacterium]|jgi:F-type H+-transporting ATPase subunit delta